MPDIDYWFAASTEEFAPNDMLQQARAAQDAGFDALGSSDHFAPWFPGGAATQAWVTLAAMGQQTALPLATGVTPVVHHYHPAVVAQAFMTLEALYPGRASRSAPAPASPSTSRPPAWTGPTWPSSRRASRPAWRRSPGCGPARR